MSLIHSPRIVTSNLILALDAVNIKSYNGTTTWYDLSGYNNHGTMYGTVPTATNDIPSFDFSTVTGSGSLTASMGFTFASNMIPTTGSFTINCWIKNPPIDSQIGMFSNAGAGDGYRFGVASTAAYVLIGGAGQVGYSEVHINFNYTLSVNTWYNVTVVFDRAGTNSAGIPQWQLYLNGIFQNSTNMVANQSVAFTNTAPGLVRSPCCTLYNGKLSLFSAYSRALTSDEIAENFNAHRGRYGI